MTLRHVERLSGESDEEFDFSSEEDYAQAQLLVPQGQPAAAVPLNPNPNLTLVHGVAPTTVPAPAGGPPVIPQVYPAVDNPVPSRGYRRTYSNYPVPEYPPPHPFETDFGNETVTAFLREEVGKIMMTRAREAAKSRTKGKQKEKESAAPPAFGLPDMKSSEFPLSDQSNRSQGSGLATRRSMRLFRKESSDRTPLNPLATPFVPDTTKRLEISPADSPSSRSDRASNFEEYTKNKRSAVRNTVQESLTSPLRVKQRQTRSSDGVLGSGPSTGETTSASGAGSKSRDLSALSLQENSFLASEQASSTGFLGRATDTLNKKFGGRLGRTLCFSAPFADDADPPVSSHPQPLIVGASGIPIEVNEEDDHFSRCFNTAKLVPESVPQVDKKTFLDNAVRVKRPQSADPEPEAVSQPSTSIGRIRLSSKMKRKEEPLFSEVKQYPRVWKPSASPGIPVMVSNLGRSQSSGNSNVVEIEPAAIWELGQDLWTAIGKFLSSQDVKNLRLVSKVFAQTLAPILLRNVVINFDRDFFNATMFNDYAANFNQFGVSFEVDLQGLAYARAKVIEKVQDAWFGHYTWPTENYPRFPELQAIEDLVDNNRPIFKEALAKVTHASELGLCIDSGHGWLEASDISDMALFDKRTSKGSKVFGKTFKTEDVWTTFARNELFRWAQQNTINATLKSILSRPAREADAKEVRFLDALRVRDIESFRCQVDQYDYDSDCHTGGIAIVANAVDPAALVNPQANPVGAAVQNLVAADANANPTAADYRRRGINAARNANRKLPQWPLIFNGYNLAAEHGGHLSVIQNKTSNPHASALSPGQLNEAQAQWLMETVWAQRAFLVAYTTAIIMHKNNFHGIHTLRISKLSSGLMPSLEQREFWKTLSGLGKLEIILSPDWRQEHVTGDKAYAQNMLISPAKAAERFTKFLRRYVTKLENLHSLTVGYVGGGEHAIGLYARNKHVLPAPIVEDPNEWLLESEIKHAPALTKFDHVRDLKFENCWLTPWMLKGFMETSRDTSLHSLTLSSVSMTTIHDDTLENALMTEKDSLRCLRGEQEWTHEHLPSGAAWVRALDAITPGKPLHEFKYDAGLIDKDENPMPERRFRGHVQKIILNSCGYVKISLPKGRASTYNQNSAVVHSEPVADRGLVARRMRFNGFYGSANEAAGRLRDRYARLNELHDKSSRTMLSPDGYAWLGTLTQCVHPIEKRVLEGAWKMNFGWPNDLSRWAAVEDGMFEGGTGRFSGVIKKDDEAI